jgi:hypothetical protein
MFLVTGSDSFRESFCVRGVHQVYRAPSETAPRHPATEEPRKPLGGFDHQVELNATDLIQITETSMGCGHTLANGD